MGRARMRWTIRRSLKNCRPSSIRTTGPDGSHRWVRLDSSMPASHLARWLSRIPTELTRDIKVQFPGMPAGGGTDNASFAPAGAPAFGLGATNWDYFSYTWHTNRDTYDKLVFDELKNNAALVACLVYLASEDPEFVPRERRVMPADRKTGVPQAWPAGTVPIGTDVRA